MAVPTLAIYNTNGNVVTGRSRSGADGIGFWLKAQLSGYQQSAAGGQVAGWVDFGASYLAGGRFLATCIYTWADYPTDTLIKVWDDGGMNAEYDGVATTEIADSQTWSNRYDPADPFPDLNHRPCMRMCLFYWAEHEPNAPFYYVLGAPTGSHIETGMPPFSDQYYVIDYPWQIDDWDVEASFRMDSVELVSIEQDDDGAAGFVWEVGQNKSGMGTTTGQFGDQNWSPGGDGKTTGGLSLNGHIADYYQLIEYVFSNNVQIVLDCGCTGSIPIVYPYQMFWPQESSAWSASSENPASASKIAVARAKCGTTQGDCHLPSDVPVYQTLSWGDGWESTARGYGGDADWTLTLETTGLKQTSSNLGSTLTWTDLGQSWQWQGALYAMDGSLITSQGTARFRDYATGQEWSGSNSPVFVRSGVWELVLLAVGVNYLDTPQNEEYNPATARWNGNEPGYLLHGLRLLNPSLFNGGEDDSRCLIQYPRDQQVYTWALADDVTIDDLDTVSPSSDGIDGWTGVNCTLSVVGGKLVASGVGANASIYRADFYDGTKGDDKLWYPKHWPPYRFARILCDVTVEAGGAVADWAGNLLVHRRHPVDGTTTRTFTTHKDIESGGVDIGARFDTCNPSERSGSDVEQSYIEQCHPAQTRLVGTEADHSSVPDEDVPSAAWGIGVFDKIEITGLTAGNKYTFDLIGGMYEAETYGKRIYVEREYKTPVTTGGDDEQGRGQFFGGYQQVVFGRDPDSSPADCHREYFDRQAVGAVNGRYGFEIASRYRWISANYEAWSDYNIALSDSLGKNSFWPADDYSAWTLTRVADLFDPAWWDAVNGYYSTEDVLFAPDVCPSFWLCDLQAASYGNGANVRDGSESLYARPLFDFIQASNWFGDGTGAEARAGHNTYRFLVKWRGRLHGLCWKNDLPPDEQGETSFPVVYVSSDGSDPVTTDPVGYSRGYTNRSPAEARYPTVVDCAPVRNRSWFRVCGETTEQATKPMGIVSSKRTGRTYAAIEIDGTLVLRIYDAVHPQYVDRNIGVTVDSGAGISIREDRKDALIFVYEGSDNDVHLITSTDEGQNWSAPVTVVAASAYPQVSCSPVDGIEIVSYIRAGNACVKRSLDGGATWSAEIVIAAASADAPAPIVPITDSRTGMWVCMVKNVAGDIDRYVSTDSGRTWAAG